MFRYLYLYDLKITCAYRRHGIGGLLIDAGMKIARETGLIGVYTIVQDNNLAAARFYLKSGGADSPRPLKLRQKGDQWFLWEYSSILSGVRIPAAEDPWM